MFCLGKVYFLLCMDIDEIHKSRMLEYRQQITIILYPYFDWYRTKENNLKFQCCWVYFICFLAKHTYVSSFWHWQSCEVITTIIYHQDQYHISSTMCEGRWMLQICYKSRIFGQIYFILFFAQSTRMNSKDGRHHCQVIRILN